MPNFPWRGLASLVDEAPARFLGSISYLKAELSGFKKADASKLSLEQLASLAKSFKQYPRVIVWTLLDCRRVTPVPPGHWLLIEDNAPFRATLEARNGMGEERTVQHVQSVAVLNGHVACFRPQEDATDAELILEHYAATSQKVTAGIHFLSTQTKFPTPGSQLPSPDSLVLLTNGIGGMARICVDLGRVNSKYDCVLGANLHPSVPADRHVFVKRIRVWVSADGFLSPLDAKNLSSFKAGPPAVWQFVANAGNGRTVASVGHKPPDRRRASRKRCQVFCVQRREKTIRTNPGTDTFDENMTVHRHARMQIRAEHTVVFGIDAPQIHTNTRHATDPIGQEGEVFGFGFRISNFGSAGRKRMAAETLCEVAA